MTYGTFKEQVSNLTFFFVHLYGATAILIMKKRGENL